MGLPFTVNPTWAYFDAEDTRALCEYLRALPEGRVLSFDTEWVDFDKDRSPVHNANIACMTLAWFEDETTIQSAYVHNIEGSEGCIAELRPIIEDPSRTWTAHSAQVDWHALMNHGMRLAGALWCTLVLSFFVDERRENRHGLKECMADYYGERRRSFAETFGSPKLRKDGQPYATGQLEVPSLREVASRLDAPGAPGRETLIRYAVQDAVDGLCLLHLFRQRLEAQTWKGDLSMWDYFLEFEVPVTRLICEAEREGLPVDLPFLRVMRAKAERDLEEVESTIAYIAGCPINPGSSKQVGQLLYGTAPLPVTKGTGRNLRVLYEIPGLGLPVTHVTETGAPATHKDAIAELLWRVLTGQISEAPECAKELLEAVARHSAISTQLSTFLVGLEEKAVNGRVHASIVHAGPTSGRFASRNPNIQNISAGDKDLYNLRDTFHAPEGWAFLVIDFNQLEYRLLAHITKDPLLVRAFNDGLDLHGLTHYGSFPDVNSATRKHFGKELTLELPLEQVHAMLKWIKEEFADTRKYAKILNFEIIYGVGPSKLAEQLRITKDAAWDRIQSWHRTYPYVRRWQERELRSIRERGYLRTLAGRYRRADMQRLNHKDSGVRGGEERSLLNAKVQGSARDVAVRAMLVLDRDEVFRVYGPRFVNQVHDEVVYLVPVNKARAALARAVDTLHNRLFATPLLVPMPVSAGVGPSWGSAKV